MNLLIEYGNLFNNLKKLQKHYIQVSGVSKISKLYYTGEGCQKFQICNIRAGEGEGKTGVEWSQKFQNCNIWARGGPSRREEEGGSQDFKIVINEWWSK